MRGSWYVFPPRPKVGYGLFVREVGKRIQIICVCDDAEVNYEAALTGEYRAQYLVTCPTSSRTEDILRVITDSRVSRLISVGQCHFVVAYGSDDLRPISCMDRATRFYGEVEEDSDEILDIVVDNMNMFVEDSLYLPIAFKSRGRV